MKYRSSLGVVINVDSKSVRLRLAPKDQYSSCKEKGCNLCAAPIKSMVINVPSKGNESFMCDQNVIVSMPVINELLAASIVFLFPIISSLISAIVIHFLLNWPLDSGKSVGIILAAFGFSFTLPILFDFWIKRLYPIKITAHGDLC